jgi:hypothetical protein
MMATRFAGKRDNYLVPAQPNEKMFPASDPSQTLKPCRLFDRQAKGTTGFSPDTWRVAASLATLHVGLAVIIALSILLSGGWVQPAAADVEGNTYTSPRYGYTITWDDTWFVADEESNPNYDYLELTNGITWAYCYGGPDPSSNPEGSLALSLSGLHSEPTYSDVAPLRDDSGKAVRFTDADRAYAAFTLTQTMPNGAAEALAVYIEVREIDPGVYFTVEAYMQVELFESERPSVEQLVNSFTPPGPVPTPSPTPRSEPKPTATPDDRTACGRGASSSIRLRKLACGSRRGGAQYGARGSRTQRKSAERVAGRRS